MSSLSVLAGTLQTCRRDVAQALQVNGSKRLMFVMLLPFAGIYQTMIGSGALDSFTGSVGIGAIVFGGPAAISLAIGDLDAGRARELKVVCVIGLIVVPGAALSAVFMTAVQAALWVEGFEFLAAGVLWIIAVDVLYDSSPEWTPSLTRIGFVLVLLMVFDVGLSIATGDVMNVQSVDGILAWVWASVGTDRGLVGRSIVAGLSGLFVVATAVVFSSPLRRYLVLPRFRMGCAITLCLVGLELVGLVADAPALTTLSISIILSFSPAADAGVH